jgi:hypothetical protein
MGLFVRRLLLLLAAVALAIFASCEEKKVGELPEVQKEHILPVSANEHEPASAPGQSPEAKPTPANFFPDSR